MKENYNNLLAIYLNEFNPEYLLKGAKKYKCKSILKILKFEKVNTYTKDQKQNYNLDPWVQSVSINTGKPSTKHRILKLGQPIDKNLVQIWDKLSKNKISCSVWGAMNSKFKKNKFIDYYFPDPWNFRDTTWPKHLISLFYLPNYYAKNYLKISLLKFFNLSILFIFTLFLNSKITNLLKDILFSLKIFFKKGIKNFILFFLYDLIFLNLFKYSRLKKKSSFSMIFLNSIAHYQHNNWNEKDNEKFFFSYVEKIFLNILILKKEFKSIIIFNGFTQKKIKPQYLLRPKNPRKFLSEFIKFKKLEQDMTNGGFIFFNDKKDKDNAFKILNNLHCFQKKIFDLKKYKNNSIFYKINLKSKTSFNKSNLKFKKNFINKSLSEIFSKKKKNISKMDISTFFMNNIKFIKTTGVHTSEGIILHENFLNLKKIKKIENHKIFNYICEYFYIS
tara:strand:+ start:2086 stop:3423 length:1338 start_codon:yes stop_codon:yes gene_type:complete